MQEPRRAKTISVIDEEVKPIGQPMACRPLPAGDVAGPHRVRVPMTLAVTGSRLRRPALGASRVAWVAGFGSSVTRSVSES